MMIEQTTASSSLGALSPELGLPSLVLDSKLKITSCSSSYLNLLQKKLEHVIDQSFQQIHPNALGSSLSKVLMELKPGKMTKVSDYCVELDIWFDYYLTHRIHDIVVLMVDVTDRVWVELEAKKQEEQARLSLEGCVIGIARLGLDGRWLGMNTRCRELFGIPENIGVEGSLRDFSLSKHRISNMSDLADMIAGQLNCLISERQILRYDSTCVWVQMKVALVRSVDGLPKYFVATFDDIAERKSAEESLQFALEAAHMADWDYDTITNTTRRSKRFDKIFGYGKALPAWGYEEFLRHIHPDDRVNADKKFRRALSEGRHYAVECRIVWPDQSVHWIFLRARVYHDDQGRTVRMAGLVMDITSDKAAEIEIQNAKMAAEDANREKSYFLANMSHEIRTPLGAILGFTDILKDSALSQEERAGYLKIISRNGRGLAKLIDDILDLSKVEAGFLEVENVTVRLTELVDDVVALLKIKADAKQIGLHVRYDGALPTHFKGDPIRLRQILMNIVGNSIKFTTVGAVTIIVRPFENLIGISICDTGVGIADTAHEKVFQPFTQADSSTSRQFGGTGLGLALSRRLATAMGGNLILASSQPGMGSEFLLTIAGEKIADAALDDPPNFTLPSNSLAPVIYERLRGLKILLAEDSPDNQVLIQRLLKKKGVYLEFAEDGVVALEKAQIDDYDLVLMDMQMPRLDGYEATRLLRASGFRRPIVALTAHAMRHDRAKCLEAGCTDYLSKPIDPTQLYRIVGEMADLSRH